MIADVPALSQRRDAIALVFLATSVPALLGVLPFAASVGSTWGAFPERDAVMWRPGGVFLLETLRVHGPERHAAARLAPWILGLYALAALVPWGAALVCFSRTLETQRLALPAAIAVSIARWPTLAALFGGATLARALVALGTVSLVELVATMSKNERTQSLAALGAVALGAAALALLRVVADFSAAACIRHGTRAIPATLAGLSSLRGALGPTMAQFLGRAAMSLAVVLLAAWTVGRLDIARSGATLGAVVIHQSALLLVVVLRVSWLRVALRAVGDRDPSDFDA